MPNQFVITMGPQSLFFNYFGLSQKVHLAQFKIVALIFELTTDQGMSTFPLPLDQGTRLQTNISNDIRSMELGVYL